MGLSGKVAIVTGASAGIGRAYALALTGAGATVVAAARTFGRADGGPGARNTLAEVVKAGEMCWARHCSISPSRRPRPLTGQMLHTDEFQQTWP